MAYEDTRIDATNLGAGYICATSHASAGTLSGLLNSTDYIAIPISVLDAVTKDEAEESEGSYRSVVRGIVDAFYNIENAKASSAKSEKMTVSRSGLSTVSGSTTEVQRTVSFTFTLDASALEVASETVT